MITPELLAVSTAKRMARQLRDAAVAELIEALRIERDELRDVDNGTLSGHKRSRGERVAAMTAALARVQGTQS